MAEKRRRWTRSFGVYKRRDHGREGQVWWIRYTHEGKQIRESTEKTSKREALQCLGERLGKVADGRFDLSMVKESPRFSEFADEFLEKYSKTNKTAQGYERDVISVKHLKLFFGDKRLNTITPMLVEHYKRKRQEAGMKPATINRELAALKTIFFFAMRNKRAANNPVSEVKLFREDNQITNVMSQEDEARLLECAAPHARRVIVCALETGMRRSEILSLRWESVDLMRGRLRVVNTKSGKMREIEIATPRLKAVLFEARKQSQEGVVFRHENGGPIASVRGAYENALRRAGLAEKHYRFHDLRHTAATRLLVSGADIVTVQELLGHSTLLMTKRYLHPGRDAQRRALERMAAWRETEVETTGQVRQK